MPDEARSPFQKPTPARAAPGAASQLSRAERELLYLKVGARCRHAQPPSPFMRALLEALLQASAEEFERVESAFPEAAAAVRRWRGDPLFSPVHSSER
jgi:hypothetical protein